MSARRLRRSGARSRRWSWLAIALPVALVGAVVAAWAIDMSALGGDVVRNVVVDGRRVGGLGSDDLLTAVGQVADDWRDMPVQLVTDDNTYDTTASKLGLQVDEQATVDAVLAVGHTGALPTRPFGWLASFVSDRTALVRFRVDEGDLEAGVAALEGASRVDPVDPTLVAGASGFEVVAGKPGEGIDVDALAAALPAAAQEGAPVTVEATTGPLPPAITDAEAQAVADEANAMTEAPFTANIAGVPVAVPPALLRTWLTPVAADGTLDLAIDAEKVIQDLQGLAPQVTQPVDARFDLVDGRPVVVPGADGTACCEPGTADKVFGALRARATSVDLSLVVTPPNLTTDEANALGIVEEVGRPDEFGPTTYHAAGEPRVTNIHRIADIIRGAVIMPGQTFSVNGYVGERTAAKGFVDAPVIYQGRFEHDIGGGVSQFATTLFNAALFAGLDFGEYQSHSIVISRYPKGHEATISYPHPDLEIKNTTPYGVLVWPTYTDTSLTVHLYSTRFVDVSLGAPTSSPQGNCTRWTTPRSRSYVDGRTANDSVFAVYRPGEGIDC